MSNLRNFEASEAWREGLKEFLTLERSTPQLKKEMSEERSLFVVDIDEDLKKILQNQNEKCTVVQDTKLKHDDVSNIRSQNKEWHQLSDESFEALEHMCDKTASDPNSTLFKYLHADQKDQILAKAKIRNVNANSGAQHGQGSKDLLQKLKDCTLLDDVEAPSNFWENSTTSDNMLYTSPVKMVGLLRPSTIMEETMTGDYEDCYVAASLNKVETTKDEHKGNCSSNYSSDTFQTANCPDDCKNTTKLPSTNMKTSLSQPSYSTNTKNSVNLEVSFESEASLEMSIIEILSDEENKVEDNAIYSDVSKDKKTKTLNLSQPIKDNCSGAVQFSIDEEEKENHFDLNSLNHIHFNDTMEEVNYIMENGQEYMTKKQEEEIYKEEKQNQRNQTPLKNELHTKKAAESTEVLHPKKLTEQKKVVTSKKFVSPQFKIPLNKKLPDNSIFDVKPIPKFNLCVNPISSNKIKTNITNNSKELNKKQFAHIVSPIGTYMKKTGTTPLMTDIKPRQINNLIKSNTFSTLEKKSRVDTPVKVQNEGAVALVGNTIGQKTLSKKAYISSGLKHIVDERSPITIPGGQKVQKCLEKAIMPAVLKHEGKIKIPDKSNYQCLQNAKLPSSKGNKYSNAVDNTSMADLSVMSGDLSLYTMNDARKF